MTWNPNERHKIKALYAAKENRTSTTTTTIRSALWRLESERENSKFENLPSQVNCCSAR